MTDASRINRIMIWGLMVIVAFLAGYGLGYIPTANNYYRADTQLNLCTAQKEELIRNQDAVENILTRELKGKEKGSSILKTILDILK